MNGRVSKYLRRVVNDSFGTLKSLEARSLYKQLKEAWRQSKK